MQVSTFFDGLRRAMQPSCTALHLPHRERIKIIDRSDNPMIYRVIKAIDARRFFGIHIGGRVEADSACIIPDCNPLRLGSHVSRSRGN